MKTLEQIKNDYAVSKGFRYWSYLLSSTSMLDEHINEVMKIYAMECLKLASENLRKEFIENSKAVDVYICLITNENNIIK